MRAGVVLAGGRSTRFGDRDKAVADLAGVPMLRRVADRLAPVVDLLVVNCRADQREAIAETLAGYDRPVRFAIDPDPDEGPMAGIRTGLREVSEARRASERSSSAERSAANSRAAEPRDDDEERSDEPRDEETEAEYAFVAACDMPFLDADLVEYLFDRAEDADADAAVPRPTEWFETTHAVYRAGAMADACDEALARGEHKIIEPLFELEYVVVGADDLAAFDSASFENVNTREEFEEAEERLRG